VRCNQTVKFTDLLQTARDLGADCLATGHYIRRDRKEGRACLRRGVDESKDQSYFLFATTPEQLDYLRFPLGGMTKAETRALAARFSLSVQDKPDSQDICFVPNGRYGDIVRKLRPGAVEAGEIRHLDGTVLGTHNGVIDYTIGQRRGLGIGGRKDVPDDDGPLYVVGIEAASHTVLVGPQSALACETVYLDEMNWISPDLLPASNMMEEGMAIFAKLRNTAPASSARLFMMEGQRVRLELEAPEYGIARGQAGVIYDAGDDSLMLGGGWIANAPTAAEIAQTEIAVSA
jgi:tRNA-specific 2-thiouridylase